MSEKPKSNKGNYIGITILIAFAFIAGISVFDLLKDPLFLQNDFIMTNLNNGYDMVCDVGLGMQLCVMNHTANNYVFINKQKDKLSLEYTDRHPCLDMILRNGTQITDIRNQPEDGNCQYAMGFMTKDGWKINELETEGKQRYGTYYAGKIVHKWWEKFWLVN